MHMRARKKNKRHSLNTQKHTHTHGAAHTRQIHTLRWGPDKHTALTSADYCGSYVQLEAWQFKESFSVLRITSVYPRRLSDVMSPGKHQDRWIRDEPALFFLLLLLLLFPCSWQWNLFFFLPSFLSFGVFIERTGTDRLESRSLKQMFCSLAAL